MIPSSLWLIGKRNLWQGWDALTGKALHEKAMIKYIFLAGAIGCEVAGTLLLPASKNFSKVVPSVSLCALYLLSFYFLTFAIKEIPLAVVYATWSGLGVFCVALLGAWFYGQSLPWQVLAGLCLIVAGVALVNGFSPQAS